MHQAEKTYLKSELKAVKLNIFGKIDEDYVSNYYGNVSDSYYPSSNKLLKNIFILIFLLYSTKLGTVFSSLRSISKEC